MPTPEEIFRALQQRAQAQQQAQQAAAEAQRKKQLYTTLGALGGAALGFGLLKLLNSDKGKQKAEDLLEKVGDECGTIAHNKLMGFLGETPLEPPTFRPPEGDIKDADFDIVD